MHWNMSKHHQKIFFDGFDAFGNPNTKNEKFEKLDFWTIFRTKMKDLGIWSLTTYPNSMEVDFKNDPKNQIGT